jgi:hypothetical protein
MRETEGAICYDRAGARSLPFEVPFAIILGTTEADAPIRLELGLLIGRHPKDERMDGKEKGWATGRR